MTQPVADAHDRTVRWRQLVDLLSRPHDEIDPALLDAALTMVRTGMRSVARAIRAAAVNCSRAVAGSPARSSASPRASSTGPASASAPASSSASSARAKRSAASS